MNVKRLEDINSNAIAKLNIMKNTQRDLIESIELIKALDYTDEQNILYDDTVWTRENLEQKSLKLLKVMQ